MMSTAPLFWLNGVSVLLEKMSSRLWWNVNIGPTLWWVSLYPSFKWYLSATHPLSPLSFSRLKICVSVSEPNRIHGCKRSRIDYYLVVCFSSRNWMSQRPLIICNIGRQTLYARDIFIPISQAQETARVVGRKWIQQVMAGKKVHLLP